MRKVLWAFIAYLLLFSCKSPEKGNWQAGECPIPTSWSRDVNPESPWASYPRPQLARDEWINLNGLWQYAILPGEMKLPDTFQGHILVPFPVESSLSGVKKPVGKDQCLWYQRNIEVPSTWDGRDILLHFEACDWETRAWIDEEFIGSHRGGYDPFSFNITSYIIPGRDHTLTIAVRDPTNEGYQPRGKQVVEPGGIFYTSVTGIWQTVWLEPVPQSYIAGFKLESDISQGSIHVNPAMVNAENQDTVRVTVMHVNSLLVSGSAAAGEPISAIIPEPRLWSPDSPFLYQMKIQLIREKEVIDEVSSYFGMRKISLGKDENGITRILLNDEFVFQNGPLDQGYWPDGLYTPPTEEAMIYDLEKIKSFGFNMLRKHVKVEPRLFYAWCDKLGLLVWQDMPNAAGYVPPEKPDLEPDTAHKAQFEIELSRMVETRWNHPSIIMWVAFNEGWGQYDTERIVSLIRGMDHTRLVSNTSGWADRGVGDVYDLHHYPDPIPVRPEENRAAVLGEFGGLGFPVAGHTWENRNWGYENMADTTSLINKYAAFYELVEKFKHDPGISACIYTQITDVETETNGLMTYDRAIVKMDENKLFRINQKVIYDE